MMKFGFFFAIFYGIFRPIFYCVELFLKGIVKLLTFIGKAGAGRNSFKDLA